MSKYLKLTSVWPQIWPHCRKTVKDTTKINRGDLGQMYLEGFIKNTHKKGDMSCSAWGVFLDYFGQFWSNRAQIFCECRQYTCGRFTKLGPKFFINKKRDFGFNSAIFRLFGLIFCMEVNWDIAELSSFTHRVNTVKLVLILFSKKRFLSPNSGPNRPKMGPILIQTQ